MDADPEILAIATAKAEQTRVNLNFQQGMSFDLPFPDQHFVHVFSSLFFHHLTREMKHKTLQELFRTLRSGGEVHIVDFERPHNLLMRIAFFSVQLLDGFETTSVHVKGILPDLFRETGFEQIRETGKFTTILGTLRSYYARKPSDSYLESH